MTIFWFSKFFKCFSRFDRVASIVMASSNTCLYARSSVSKISVSLQDSRSFSKLLRNNSSFSLRVFKAPSIWPEVKSLSSFWRKNLHRWISCDGGYELIFSYGFFFKYTYTAATSTPPLKKKGVQLFSLCCYLNEKGFVSDAWIL